MINVAVIGYGYWGPNLARNFVEAPGSKMVAISEVRSERLALAGARYPHVRTTTSYEELLSDPQIDAVVIAAPVSTHFDLAMKSLQAGKHVLVAKPLATSSEQVARLIDEAARRRRVLMVDHTFVYTSAVRKIRELTTGGEVGEIYYLDSVRINLGLFQHDVNVIWDLAVHDLSIMDYVLPQQPLSVSVTGAAHVPGEFENIAYLTVFFDGGLIAHIHVNWLAPVKVRRTLIGGSRRMIVYDDLEASEKVKVYDRGVVLPKNPDQVYQLLVGYRTGDMWAPQLAVTEALQVEAAHFIKCIEEGQRPTTDGEAGLRVVRLLEAATESMAQQGRPVNLKAGAWTA